MEEFLIQKIEFSAQHAMPAPPIQEAMGQADFSSPHTPGGGHTNKPPRLVQPLRNAEVMEGIRFTFECRFFSEEVPRITWYKDNIVLDSPDYETQYLNGLATLTIEETFSEDTARYSCRASNFAGHAETSAFLNVRGKETFFTIKISVGRYLDRFC